MCEFNKKLIHASCLKLNELKEYNFFVAINANLSILHDFLNCMRRYIIIEIKIRKLQTGIHDWVLNMYYGNISTEPKYFLKNVSDKFIIFLFYM